MRARRPAELILLGALAWPAEAAATYSIVGVDLERGAVGGAVASCVPLEVLLRVYGGAPGRGALVTQSFLHPTAHDVGLSALAGGAAPDEVLALLVDPAFDADFERRQYAVVDAAGARARFTGPEALPWAGDDAGDADGHAFAAQGNILTGPEVVGLALDAAEAPACDLGERLLAALEAPAAAGLGDSRCTPYGLPARSAVLFVDPPDAPAGTFLALSFEAPDPTVGPSEDPVAALRAAFAGWREGHPCELPPAAARDPGCGVGAPGGSPLVALGLAAALAARRRRGGR